MSPLLPFPKSCLNYLFTTVVKHYERVAYIRKTVLNLAYDSKELDPVMAE